jgi:hypothetical protein
MQVAANVMDPTHERRQQLQVAVAIVKESSQIGKTFWIIDL